MSFPFFHLIFALLALFALSVIALRTIRHSLGKKYLIPLFIAKFINSSWRKTLQPPTKMIKRSGIKKGMTVLEIGCGTGTYSLAAAEAIGAEGKLIASDIQRPMIEQLERNVKKLNIDGIDLLVADSSKLPFPNHHFDLIFLVSVFPSIQNVEQSLNEIARVLKREGLLAISEFLIDPDYLSRNTIIKRCGECGFKPLSNSGNFFNYTLTFSRDS